MLRDIGLDQFIGHCIYFAVHFLTEKIQLATDDPVLQFETLKAVVNLFAKELNDDAISAVLGTKRDRLIRQLTRCPDPYREHKKKSNQVALELASAVQNLVKEETDPYKRFSTGKGSGQGIHRTFCSKGA